MKTALLLLIFPLQLLSQDISGVWTGMLHTRGNDLPYELVISEHNKDLNGYSLIIFTIDSIKNIGVKSVELKRKKGYITIEDNQLLYNNYSSPARRIKLLGLLSLKVEDNGMVLSGNFRTRVLDLRATANSSYTGTIRLYKKKNDERTRLIAHLDTMNLLSTLSFLQPEKEEPLLTIVRIEKPQLPIVELKDKDAAMLTIKEPVIIVVPATMKNEADSILKNDTAKNVQAPVVKMKIKEAANPAVVAKEPKQLPAVKEKPVESTPDKGVVKNIQPSAEQTKIKKTANPIVAIKEPTALPAVKENPVDSSFKEIAKINPPPKAETKTTQTVEIKITETPDQAPAAAAITERETVVIRNIYFRSDTLLLSLYDNGVVDGDTVSVVLNGKVIIAKQKLTEKALRVMVQITPDLGDSLLLTMYAENLGTIPPNTGLLIIQDGEERSQVRFEGDLQKSSAVILRRKR